MTTFNSGDYVRTSKGKIGVIEEPACIQVGCYNFSNKWICLERVLSYENFEVQDAVEQWQWSFPNQFIEWKKTPNKVLLGNNLFDIWSDKLTKLNRLSIKIGSQVIELPVEDAGMFIEILKKNKIYFQFI